jgi:hypothetical protein
LAARLVTDPFILAVFYCFVPAMGFLYILLHEYQHFYNEKKMFRTFFVGMIAGAVLTLLEQFFRGGGGVGLLLMGALLAVLEALAFTAVLNWRPFRGRRDTPYYGLAFGLGFGATAALFGMFLVLLEVERSGSLAGLDVWTRLFQITMLALHLIGGILIHGAMGGWIGHGTGTGPLPKYVLLAGAVRFAYHVLFVAILFLPALLGNVLTVLSLAFAIWVIMRVLRNVLDRLVPPEILREMGIHQRRIGRRILREQDEGRPPSD